VRRLPDDRFAALQGGDSEYPERPYAPEWRTGAAEAVREDGLALQRWLSP